MSYCSCPSLFLCSFFYEAYFVGPPGLFERRWTLHSVLLATCLLSSPSTPDGQSKSRTYHLPIPAPPPTSQNQEFSMTSLSAPVSSATKDKSLRPPYFFFFLSAPSPLSLQNLRILAFPSPPSTLIFYFILRDSRVYVFLFRAALFLVKRPALWLFARQKAALF